LELLFSSALVWTLGRETTSIPRLRERIAPEQGHAAMMKSGIMEL
jgi:hypothetical protein